MRAKTWVGIVVLAGVFGVHLCAAIPAAELGKWWKNSEIVTMLHLSESQVSSIEQVFLQHRIGLAEANAEFKEREASLKDLMESDDPDEGAVLAATEAVAGARAALERTNSAMMVGIRRCLTVEQWQKLKALQELRANSSSMTPLDDDEAASDDGEIYSIADSGGRVKPPTCLFRPMPSYTQAAKEAKIEGLVLVEGIVRKNGRVADLKILRGIGYGLDEKVLETLRDDWRFSPATRDGKPVAVRVRIEVSFRRY